MTDLPSDLDAWTYNTIKDLVTHHAHEPQHFDFKEQLNYEQSRRDDMNRALVRTVCAMANSNTGFLIFGVRDTRRESGNSEDRICGIPIKGDYRRNFAEKIKGIQPEVHFEAASRLIPLPTDSSRGIFVVRIPLSPQRPHMDSGSGVFHTRGDGGNARHMSFYEVREQMMRTEALM